MPPLPLRWAVNAAVGKIFYSCTSAAMARRIGLRERNVDVGDARISYFESGDSSLPCLLLLHGLTGNKSVWTSFARHFVGRFRIIIPDLPGHGRSSFDHELDYGVASQATRVATLLDRLGVYHAHLIGNSMGGWIACELALRNAGVADSLALLSPAGIPSPRPSWMDSCLCEGRNPFLVDDRRQFSDFFSAIMSAPPYTPGPVRDYLASRYRHDRPQIAKLYEHYNTSPSLRGDLAKLKSPTLLIWGRNDQIIDVSCSEIWASQITGATVETWEGVGHMPMLELPTRTALRVRSHLQSLDVATDASPPGSKVGGRPGEAPTPDLHSIGSTALDAELATRTSESALA